MHRLFLFGLGYTAARLATVMEARGWEVISTGSAGTLRFDDASSVRRALADVDQVLSSVPPGADGDPVAGLDRAGAFCGGPVEHLLP